MRHDNESDSGLEHSMQNQASTAGVLMAAKAAGTMEYGVEDHITLLDINYDQQDTMQIAHL
jgi:hypothetical protein